MPSVHMRALTAPGPIRPTSASCRSARQPNPGQRLHLSTRKFCSKIRGRTRLTLCSLTSLSRFTQLRWVTGARPRAPPVNVEDRLNLVPGSISAGKIDWDLMLSLGPDDRA
jgi:hypothetical protein